MESKLKKFRPESIVCLLLILANLIVYLQVKNFEFVDYDDDNYIFNNLRVKTGLNKENIEWAFTQVHSCNWHPMTWLSHMLDAEFFGMNSGAHHLSSLFFHIINTILLFVLIRKMKGTIWQSALIAGLFAVHPLNVESVAWVSERKNVLSTLFLLLTLIIYIDYVKNPKFRKYLLLITVFALGLMSKPMLVTLPFVLLLFDYWPLKRINFKPIIQKYNFRFIKEKILLFIMVIASIIITLFAQKSGGAVISSQVIPIKQRLLNTPISYVSYIIKMIWPHKLGFFYSYPQSIYIKALFSTLLLMLITIIIIRSKKRYPFLLFGWLWYLGTLVPVIGLVQVGSQAMADRYAYISLIGLFIMIAWIVPVFMSRWAKRETIFSISAGILLIVLIICSWLQTQKWKNSMVLCEHGIRVDENNYLAYNNLGYYFFQNKRYDESIEYYSKALKINPNYAKAHNNLGAAFVRTDQLDKAISHYSKALQIDPLFEHAHNGLGVALVKKGQIEEGINHISKAIRVNSNYVEAYNSLGVVYYMQGKLDKAIVCFQRALKINPGYADARKNLKVVLSKKKNND